MKSDILMYKKRTQKLWLIGFILILTVTLYSCIGIDTTIKINEDGSGVLNLTYRISKMVVNLGNTGDESGVKMPFPVNEQDFKRSIEGLNGIELAGFKKSENEDDVVIKASISFASVEDLNQIRSFADYPVSIVKEENKVHFKQLLAKKAENEIDKDSLEMIKTFFRDYRIIYTITAPKEILSYNMGKISSDKKTVTLEATVAELLTAKKDVEINVIW